MKKIANFYSIGTGAGGFTIIEALIALLILSFAILGIFRIHLRAVETSAFNRRMMTSVQFGRSAIDQFRSERFSFLASGTDTSGTAADYYGTDYKLLRVKTISSVSGLSKVKKAHVQIGWNNIGDCTTGTISGCDHNIVLESYLVDF